MFVGAEKGHDAYLLRLWKILPEWGHKLLSGWRPLRQLWWVWLCLGLSGGLGGALWLSPALSVPSPAALTKAAAEAKAQQFAEDQKQLFGLQTDARARYKRKRSGQERISGCTEASN